ncbi:class I SAM-dependent methyltransferase [Promicromonospora thailandica]|uniref:class I SAM-dependent methyltransferase n=1 Tax=Promicromonospora thailandica TaxID=765201 RepID=UPI0027E23824|nr:methyltransferase domain-containing protein [Promicromonospora thailandica]BFF20927.1 class I SAM-dependent methyltransferase [Promicromonospora thailandica]
MSIPGEWSVGPVRVRAGAGGRRYGASDVFERIPVFADHYDSFAAAYDAENTSSLLNTYYNHPAMVDLAGDVAGLQVLDAGCGSGPLTAALRSAGAVMTGIDGSPEMLATARRRLGDDVPLHVADLAEPLPFADDAFDVVVCSLVLHYLEDWDAPLAEFRRVLRPGGRLVLSVNHPTVFAHLRPTEDYFAVHRFSDEFRFGDQEATLTFWHRPLHAMFDAFRGAGFAVSAVAEPAPAPDTPVELLPPRIVSGERSRFLSFLYFVLTP